MRSAIFITLLCFSVSCVNTKHATALKKLNGTWIPLKQEMGGKVLPESFFKEQKLIISDSNYTVIAESTDKGVVRLNGNKMDIYGKEGVNKGKHFTAIYKYENNELTICYNLKGNDYPADFKSGLNPLYFLSVFKR